MYCKELSRVGQTYAAEYSYSPDDEIIIGRLQKAVDSGKDSAIKAHRKDLRKSVRAHIASNLEGYVTEHANLDIVLAKYAEYADWYENAVAEIRQHFPPTPIKALKRLVPEESGITDEEIWLSVHIGCQSLNMADALGYSMPIHIEKEEIDSYLAPAVTTPPFSEWYAEKAQKNIDAAVEQVMKHIEATVGYGLKSSAASPVEYRKKAVAYFTSGGTLHVYLTGTHQPPPNRGD